MMGDNNTKIYFVRRLATCGWGLLIFLLCRCAPTIHYASASSQIPPPINNIQIEKLKQEIRRFYPAPYRWGGDNIDGVDCSGFVSSIYRNALGIQIPRTVAELYKFCTPVPTRNLYFGDLVFFGECGKPTHVGFYIEKGYFMDSSLQKGVGVNKLSNRYYRKRYLGAGRIRFTHSF